MLKVLELFAGIGACSKALERLGIEHEIVDAVEIDKYAIQSFNAIHGSNFEVQDITKWDKNIEVDLVMHGSPCQDFSLAGKQAGGDLGSGTRSSLMYETIRIVGKLRPKYVIWENVKNVLSKNHKHNFDRYIETMEALGYRNYYKVLDAKDYGVPQHRERVFTVSILGGSGYEFPEKEELKIRLKDILEEEVDKKYYLNDVQIKRIETTTYNVGKTRIQEKDWCDTLCARDWKDPKCVQVGQMYGTEKEPNPQAGRVYSSEGISPTMDSCSGGNRMPKIEVIGNYSPSNHDASRVVDSEGIAPTVKENHGTVTAVAIDENKVIIGSTQKHTAISKDGIVPTLTSAMGQGGGHVPMHNYDRRVRKLTPKECWRLMGFDDSDIDKAIATGMSNTQLYKQAGNSIVVNVLERILKGLLWEME